MDSRLESLIVEAAALIHHQPQPVDRAEKIAQLAIRVDKSLRLRLEVMEHCHRPLEDIVFFGLRHWNHKPLLTAALSLATYTTRSYACKELGTMFNCLMHLFVSFTREQQSRKSPRPIEFVLELSYVSQSLQNLIIGNGVHCILRSSSRLNALLSVCERGFISFPDVEEISPRLLKAIMFMWPAPTNEDRELDQAIALEFDDYVKLIVKKLEVEVGSAISSAPKVRNTLLCSLVSALDRDHFAVVDIYKLILGDCLGFSPKEAGEKLGLLLESWLREASSEPMLATDRAIISLRAIRRVCMAPRWARSPVVDRLVPLLMPRAISLLEQLITRQRQLLSPFYSHDRHSDSSGSSAKRQEESARHAAPNSVYRLDPYDRLITGILARFFIMSRNADLEWHNRLLSSLDSKLERRLIRVLEFACSKTTYYMVKEEGLRKMTLEPHSQHIWADYLSEAKLNIARKQTAAVQFQVDPTNRVKRFKIDQVSNVRVTTDDSP